MIYTAEYEIGAGTVDVEVHYCGIRGYRPCLNDPGAPDEIEISDIRIARDGVPLALPEWLADQIEADLAEDLMADWMGGIEYAREQAAEWKREQRMA